MPGTQRAPVLLARATRYRLRGRVHFPKDGIGRVWRGVDEDYVVFRRMVLDPEGDHAAPPRARFVVAFDFARFSAKANQRLSLIPAPFIAAQPGFRSKTWMLGQKTGRFRGVYEWDTVADAEAYWTSLPMRMMKRRADPDSIVHEVSAT